MPLGGCVYASGWVWDCEYASGWDISTFVPKLVWNKLSEFGIISFGRMFQTMNFGTASPQYSKLILVTNLKNPDVSSVAYKQLQFV